MSNQDAKMVNGQVCALLLKSNKRFNYRAIEGRDAVYFKLDDGSEVYVLYKNNEIIYNGKLYDMDEQNKLLVSQIEQKQLRRSINREMWGKFKQGSVYVLLMITFCGAVAFVIGAAGYGGYKDIQRHKRDKQASEHRESLPNWDDSIRLAETDEELANAINRREQAKLKVKYYRDSLEHVR